MSSSSSSHNAVDGAPAETKQPPQQQEKQQEKRTVLQKGIRKVTKSIVACPLAFQCCTCIFTIVVIGIIASFSLFEITNDDNGFALRDDVRTELVDAVDEATTIIDNERAGVHVILQQQSSNPFFDLFLLFRSESSELQVPSLVTQMNTVGTLVANDPHFPHFCFVSNGTTGTCKPPVTFTEISSPYIEPSMLPQLSLPTTQAAIDSLLLTYATDPDLSSDRDLLFDYTQEPTKLRTRYGRSLFQGGAPLAGYRSRSDDKQDQRADFRELIRDLHETINVDKRFDDGGMEVILYGNAIWDLVFDEQSAADLAWAVGAVIFVFFFMLFHLQSLWLAFAGSAQIVLSFPLAYFIYRVFLNVKMFNTLHSLAVFIVLGIGADDVFVFTDAWNQFGSDHQDLEQRMELTYLRASKAMLATSFTTMAAFFATSLSEILPIASFGLWAACLIFVNYCLVLTFFPAAIVQWERSIRKRESCCCISRCISRRSLAWRKSILSSVAPKSSTLGAGESIDSRGLSTPNQMATPASEGMGTPGTQEKSSKRLRLARSVRNAKKLQDSFHAPGEKHRLMEVWFHHRFFPWLHKWNKVLSVGFVALFIVSISLGSQLEALQEAEQFLPDDHFLRRGDEWLDKFRATEFDNNVRVTLMWGVLGIDRSGTAKYDPDDKGTPIWDTTFDASDPAAQQTFLDSCATLEAATDLVLSLKSCWPRDFRDYLVDRGLTFPFVPSTPAPANLDATMHRQIEFGAAMEEFSRTPQGGVAVSNNLVGLVPRKLMDLDGAEVDFSKVVLSQVEVVSTMPPQEPRSYMLPRYELWQRLVTTINAAAPPTANRALQYSNDWLWMVTENELVRSALQGMGISVAVSLAVLVLSTTNIYVSLLAMASVVGIVSGVLGMAYILGFSLGVTESMSSIIVIGFSFDYVVHIGNAYVESVFKTRGERTRDSLTEMGISILAGAMTTGGSALFLYGGVILFFKKMATILIITVLFSLLWSTVGFSALLSLIGPEHDSGSVLALVNWARSKCSSSKSKQSRENPGDVELVATKGTGNSATAPQTSSAPGTGPSNGPSADAASASRPSSSRVVDGHRGAPTDSESKAADSKGTPGSDVSNDLEAVPL